MSQNRNDKMESFLRVRLDGYEHTVKDDVWVSLEGKLPAFRARQRHFKPAHIIMAITGVAAIFALVLVVSRRVVMQPDMVPAIAVTDVSELDKGTDAIVRIEPETVVKAAPQTDIKTVVQTAVKPVTQTVTQIYGQVAELSADKNIPETTIISGTEPMTTAKSAVPPYSDNVHNADLPKVVRNHYVEIWPDEKATKRKDRRNLSLAFAMNGTLPDNAYSSKIIIHRDGGYLGSGEREELVETKTGYDFPVTAGLLLRYGLTPRFALESGLNYTLLGARVEIMSDGAAQSQSSYKLHYLGIPLRASFPIYDSRLMTIYGSAGVMAEKLVSGTSETVSLPRMATETSDIATDNWLWSVSGIVGANFKLGRTVGIFIEPELGYYFDDGVGVPTIRRDRPLNFNFRIGVRINLN